jgi:hypothetical protein
MSILSKAISGRRGRAQKVVIYGPEGFGKSTLASLFPKPLFLDVEDSTSQMDVLRLGRECIPDLKTFESALDEVRKTKPCATLNVDTIDWLEEMAAVDLCAEHKVSNIEEILGGYGKGYNLLTNRVMITLSKLDAIIDVGIHVVLIAHSSITRFDPPDGAGAYDRYELKLYKDRKGGKGTASLIKEWCDMLLFGNWKTQIAEKGKGQATTYKGIGGRERMLYCNRSAAWDAKNRHGMADVEPWDIATIEKAFRAVHAPWSSAAIVPNQTEQKGVSNDLAKTETKVASSQPEGENPPVASAVEGMQQTAISKQKVAEDNIPMEHGTNGQPIDAELKRICEPFAAAINGFLIAGNRIKPGQTWADMPADFAERVKRNPAAFLKQAQQNGKVAA